MGARQTAMDAMAIALVEAGRVQAGKRGEVPVGAALLSAAGWHVARLRGQRRSRRTQDASAHAELIVMRDRRPRSWARRV